MLKKNKKKIIIFSLLLIVFIMFIFVGKKLMIRMGGNYIYNKLEIDNTDRNKENNNSASQDTSNKNYITKNILLLGVEEFNGATNTDSIIIASLNTKDKTLKLTSLLRDLYVEIPGYSNNKLNSAYSKGGINLLYETIKENFGIHMDGYVLVNFDSLENIIDYLGGIEVTLTKKEADYLNAKNYISNPKNRNVIEGTQIMNGNQVVGYCRVRRVSTGTENNDFGRTQRQRKVLNAICDKIKKLNMIQLTLFLNNTLSDTNIKTDISKKEFNQYLEQSINIFKEINISEYRVPADGTYESQKVMIGNKEKDVLVPKNWATIRYNINEFIYETKKY